MDGPLMRLTCLHAPSSYQQRQHVWDQLRRLSHANILPWIYVGDFNEILYPWEKVGRRQAERYRLHSFWDFINDCAFMELDNKGCAFTWINNRADDDLVKEHLD